MTTRLPILGAAALRDANIGYALIDFADPNRCELKLPGADPVQPTAESLLTVTTSPKRVRAPNGRLVLTASNSIPYTYGLDGKLLGALIEPEATNASTNSAGGTDFTAVRTTITASQHVDALGNVALSKIIPNTDNNTHFVRQLVSNGGVLPFAFSAFFRAGEITRVDIELQNSIGEVAGTALIDLLSGAIVSSTGTIPCAVERYGDDLWRVHTQATLGAGSTAALVAVYAVQGTTRTFTGDGIGGFFFGSTQIEIGEATPSSYIVTAGSSVLRPADAIRIPSATVAQIVPNAFEGTLIVEAYPVLSDGGAVALWKSTNDATAHTVYSIPGTGTVSAYGASLNEAYDAGFFTSSGAVTWTPGSLAKAAYRWSNTRRAALASQTGAFGTNTTARTHPLASSFGAVALGHAVGLAFGPSIIRRALIVNRGLSNDEIRALLA